MFTFLCISFVAVLLVAAYCSYLYRVDLRLANLVDNVRLSAIYSKVVALNRKDRLDVHSRIKNRKRTLRLLGASRSWDKAWKSFDRYQARKAARHVLAFA